MEIKIRKATAWGKAILKWKDSPSEKKEKKKKKKTTELCWVSNMLGMRREKVI